MLIDASGATPETTETQQEAPRIVDEQSTPTTQ